MMNKKLELLSSLLREFENESGTSDLFMTVLKTLKQSLQEFESKDTNDFHEQFNQLIYLLCNTKPKFGIFRYYLEDLRYEFDQLPHDANFNEFFEQQIQKIDHQEKQNQKNILENANTLDVHKKSILIYEQSHNVQNVLKYFKNQNKIFNVIVAEQEYEKTHTIIEFLHEEDIPFQVVPDYMLSHIDKNVDLVFFGALTLQDTMEFVMPTGSHAVISEFNTMNIPVYMFLQTTKFSLWPSEKKEIYHKKETRRHYNKPINYERLKFSHDRVHMDLFDKIITEEGILSPEELKHCFDKKFEEHQKKEKKYNFSLDS
jgi:translation initiation factor 2B subunit (eIF-2B alpha/beta/delta family)